MKHTKIWNGLLLLLWFVLLAVEGLTMYTIVRINMLPDHYLIILASAFAVVWVLMGLMLLPGRNQSGSLRRGIAAVLILVLCVGCAVVSTVVSDVYETMNNVLGDPSGEEEKPTRSVYVLQDDPAQSIADAAEYVFGKIDRYDTENVQQAVDAIGIATGKTPKVMEYSSLTAMVDALYAGEVDAIIVSDVNLDILANDDNYTDIFSRVRLLYSVEIDEQPAVSDTTPTTEPTAPTEEPVTAPSEEPTTEPVATEPPDVSNTPFLVYVGGSDTRSAYLSKSRNDVNILAVVNPVTKQILLINTPRDFFVENPAGNNALDKLTHCGLYGVENSAQALAQLYDQNVEYYAQINFAGFETMIDAIGGVTIYSDVSFYTIEGYYIAKGENTLGGAKALSFARERSNVAGGDETRGENQMKVIRAVIQKLTTGTTVITRYAEILDSLKGMFTTNLTMDEISLLVKMQLSDMASWEVLTYSVTGFHSYGVNYSDPGRELYVMEPNMETVDAAKALIQRVLDGEVLTQDDLK